MLMRSHFTLTVEFSSKPVATVSFTYTVKLTFKVSATDSGAIRVAKTAKHLVVAIVGHPLRKWFEQSSSPASQDRIDPGSLRQTRPGVGTHPGIKFSRKD